VKRAPLPGQGRLIVGTVYLLHFSRPYKHARHYVGFTTDLPRRLRQHRGGHGPPLIRHAVEDGVRLILARTWEMATVGFERRMHTRAKTEWCPVCHGTRALSLMQCIRNPVSGIGH
jgi:predicted GIY-YIG superfamily endonuclease